MCVYVRAGQCLKIAKDSLCGLKREKRRKK